MKIENNYDEFQNFVSNIKNINSVTTTNNNHGDIIKFTASKNNRVFEGVLEIFDDNINKLHQKALSGDLVKDSIVVNNTLFKIYDSVGDIYSFEYRRNIVKDIAIHLTITYI